MRAAPLSWAITATLSMVLLLIFVPAWAEDTPDEGVEEPAPQLMARQHRRITLRRPTTSAWARAWRDGTGGLIRRGRLGTLCTAPLGLGAVFVAGPEVPAIERTGLSCVEGRFP